VSQATQAKSYYPLTYHCAIYYHTGLTIYQLQVLIIPNYLIIPLLLHMHVQTIFPSTNIRNSTTYIYIYTYIFNIMFEKIKWTSNLYKCE